MGVYLHPSGTENPLQNAYIGEYVEPSTTMFFYNFEQNLNDSSGNNRTASGSNIGYEQVGGQYVVTNTATINSYITPPAISGSGITDFTISFWLYPVDPGTVVSYGTTYKRQPLIFAQSESSSPYKGPNIFFGPDAYGSGWNTNSLLFRLSGNTQQHTGAISLNTWHHVVFTRNSGTCKAYVDGVNELTWTDTTTWASPAQTYIFNSNNDVGSTGEAKQARGNTGAKMDRCKYETIGWSSTDVTNDYNATKSIYGVS